MRMSRVIILGLAGGAILPTLAAATDQDINLTANVQKFCAFPNNPTIDALNNMTPGAITPSQSVVDVTPGSIVNGFLSGDGHGFQYTSQGTCNHPSKVYLKTLNGGLKDPTPESVTSGTFATRIDYLATAGWDGAPLASLHTTGTAGAQSIVRLAAGPHAGSLTVHVELDPNASPLAAGDYTDTLTVTVEPQ